MARASREASSGTHNAGSGSEEVGEDEEVGMETGPAIAGRVGATGVGGEEASSGEVDMEDEDEGTMDVAGTTRLPAASTDLDLDQDEDAEIIIDVTTTDTDMDVGKMVRDMATGTAGAHTPAGEDITTTRTRMRSRSRAMVGTIHGRTRRLTRLRNRSGRQRHLTKNQRNADPVETGEEAQGGCRKLGTSGCLSAGRYDVRLPCRTDVVILSILRYRVALPVSVSLYTPQHRFRSSTYM